MCIDPTCEPPLSPPSRREHGALSIARVESDAYGAWLVIRDVIVRYFDGQQGMRDAAFMADRINGKAA